MRKLIILIYAIFTLNIANAQWVQTSLDTSTVTAFAISGNDIFAASSNGGEGVHLSNDNGNSWLTMNTGFPSNIDIQSLAIIDSNIFAGTWGSGMYLSTNYANNWATSGLTGAEVKALAINNTNIFAGTEGGGVNLSTDNGSTWTAVNTGMTNAYILSLAINGSTIYSGTNSGIFMSTNNGTTWTLSGLSGHYIEAIATKGSNVFAALGVSGGVYLSSDNGSSWTVANTGLPANTTVFSLAISGNFIFAGTNGKGVYLSTNNGSSWTAVNTGLTSLKVNSLIISGNYLFAGTNSGGVWKESLSDFVQYTITASANPTTYGTTSGGGSYILNQSCTVKTTPNSGYTFVNWTETSNIVSTDTSYTFTVTANRNLSANFILDTTHYTIITSSTPTIGGNTTGGGAFTINQLCTVKATHNTGYVFVKWTENGTTVSTDTSYAFSVTANRNLVANFSSTQGIIANTLLNTVNLYPNPSTAIFNLTSNNKSDKTCDVKIYNMMGNVVKEFLWNGDNTTFDLSNNASGFYFIKVSCKDNVEVQKLMVR